MRSAEASYVPTAPATLAERSGGIDTALLLRLPRSTQGTPLAALAPRGTVREGASR